MHSSVAVAGKSPFELKPLEQRCACFRSGACIACLPFAPCDVHSVADFVTRLWFQALLRIPRMLRCSWSIPLLALAVLAAVLAALPAHARVAIHYCSGSTAMNCWFLIALAESGGSRRSLTVTDLQSGKSSELKFDTGASKESIMYVLQLR